MAVTITPAAPEPAPIVLTEEQKALIMARYADLDIHSLTRLVFSNERLDGRTREGRAVKEHLSGHSITIKASKHVPVGVLELTEDQRAKVQELAPSMENVTELTQAVFNDPSIKKLSREWRAVNKALKEIYPKVFDVSEEPVDDTQYEPPSTLQALVGVVNKEVSLSDTGKKVYQWGALKTSDDRQLRALMGYLRVFTLRYVASQYTRQVERDLFISTFIRWTHDKSDLTQIEVDQMINAAAERVTIAQMEREIQRITKMQDEILEGAGEVDENGKKRRFGMNDVELINGVRARHDSSKKRLESLMSSLEESRAKRKQSIDARSGSVLFLFDAWMKDEQKRNDLLDLGSVEHAEDAKEVGRIRDLDDMTAIISGQTEDEAANG